MCSKHQESANTAKRTAWRKERQECSVSNYDREEKKLRLLLWQIVMCPYVVNVSNRSDTHSHFSQVSQFVSTKIQSAYSRFNIYMFTLGPKMQSAYSRFSIYMYNALVFIYVQREICISLFLGSTIDLVQLERGTIDLVQLERGELKPLQDLLITLKFIYLT